MCKDLRIEARLKLQREGITDNKERFLGRYEMQPRVQVKALTLDQRRLHSVEMEGRGERMDTNGGRIQIAGLSHVLSTKIMLWTF